MALLSPAQVDQFQEQGFLFVEDILDPEKDIDPIIDEYRGVMDSLAHELFSNGEISSPYDNLPFGERFLKILTETGKTQVRHFDFSLPQKGIQHDTPIWVGPAVFNALTNPKLLDAVESIIGPEIYSNPIQHLRIKPPQSRLPKDEHPKGGLIGATPWHQDNGVVLPEADQTDMLTVWFSLDDATVEKGCLEVIPYSHVGGLRTHCPRGKRGVLAIPDKLLELNQSIPVPTKKGDALFLHRRTCHDSLPNVSHEIRWSFDLRYNPIGQATGRGMFPGFVARSRSNPDSELRDPEIWAQMWYDARRDLAESEQASFNRWSKDNPVCA